LPQVEIAGQFGFSKFFVEKLWHRFRVTGTNIFMNRLSKIMNNIQIINQYHLQKYAAKCYLILVFILLSGLSVFAQKQTPSNQSSQAIKATPAYAELLLRKAELESDVEGWLATYTEEYPKLKEARFELDLIKKDLAKILAQTDASLLTLALGKLLVRKNQLAADLWALQNQYGKDHPEVKRTQRKFDSFQNSIKEILP
jgi:hypothetical protein